MRHVTLKHGGVDVVEISFPHYDTTHTVLDVPTLNAHEGAEHVMEHFAAEFPLPKTAEIKYSPEFLAWWITTDIYDETKDKRGKEEGFKLLAWEAWKAAEASLMNL